MFQLLLQSSVLHDPSEIIPICWFAGQLLYYQLLLVIYIFLWKPWYILWWIESSKEQHLFEAKNLATLYNKLAMENTSKAFINLS